MDLAWPDFELYFDSVGPGLVRYANAVIADHLVFADLNALKAHSPTGFG
jgi:hypothetical protein